MNNQSEKERIIGENYDSFESVLPSIIEQHRGEYALMRDKAIVDYFNSASDAQRDGTHRFNDGLFSVQKVELKAIDLGFYSYARYRRVA